ncbi:MAG TPA: hypothetical protein VGL76_11345 [Gaiellaceae bacterium]
MRAFRSLAGVSAALALLAAGCGSTAHVASQTTAAAPAKPTCAFPAAWQSLANHIGAAVYCPGWLPDPLTSQIRGPWNNINSVSKDRSYLESFIWQDTDSPALGGELHVILRGYPGRTKIPSCPTGAFNSDPKPCFAQPRGHVHLNGIDATIDTVNQGADEWHVALVWHLKGSLYTLSEHLAPPVDNYDRLMTYLRHELRSLVLIKPTRST